MTETDKMTTEVTLKMVFTKKIQKHSLDELLSLKTRDIHNITDGRT